MGTAIFLIKPINPRAVSTKQLRGAVSMAIRKTAELAKKDLQDVTNTWADKPTFTISSERYAGGGVELVIEPSGDSHANDVFRWLNNGTQKRYATMTQDFQPKTKVGWIGSNAGQGGLAFVNRNLERPGIKARNWTFVIQMNRQKTLREKLASAISKYRPFR